MKIGICNDHRGLMLKNYIIDLLDKNGYIVIDYGTNSDSSSDFPDYAYMLGKAIINSEVELGIAICGTGIGMSIALNKIKGIYCGKVNNSNEAFLIRSHNNANCMAIGEDLSNVDEVILNFVNTPFSNEERHVRRVNKIRDIENG